MVNIISQYISKIINWLYSNRLVTLLLILAYSAGIIFLHDSLVNVSVKIMNSMGLNAYNTFISLITAFALAIVSIFILYSVKTAQEFRKAKMLFPVAIVALMAIHYFFLLEMNIEIVHAFAYGGLVFLIYGLTKRYAAAIIWAVPVMLIDEWYQYMVLYPHYVEYWELNDVVLDMLGGTFMLMLIFLANAPHKISKPYYLRSEFLIGGTMVVAFIALVSACVIATHTSTACPQTIFTMSKMAEPHTGWHVHGFTQKTYYILSPAQSIIIVSAISFLLMAFDNFIAKYQRV